VAGKFVFADLEASQTPALVLTPREFAQIDKPILQPGFILLPRHAIHSRCSLPPEGVETVPEQTDGNLVK
jgi:hypothetical protein